MAPFSSSSHWLQLRRPANFRRRRRRRTADHHRQHRPYLRSHVRAARQGCSTSHLWRSLPSRFESKRYVSAASLAPSSFPWQNKKYRFGLMRQSAKLVKLFALGERIYWKEVMCLGGKMCETLERPLEDRATNGLLLRGGRTVAKMIKEPQLEQRLALFSLHLLLTISEQLEGARRPLAHW